MLASGNRFRPNDRECAAKVIDGEAVIINLLDGTYYSLDKVGGAVWELLSSGHTVNETSEAVTARYDVTIEQARRDVERMVDELMGERLLVAADEMGATAATGTTAPSVTDVPPVRLRYETPELTTFRDMADLLALDPPMPRLEDIGWTEPVGDSGSEHQG